jgi:hypothetical protein
MITEYDNCRSSNPEALQLLYTRGAGMKILHQIGREFRSSHISAQDFTSAPRLFESALHITQTCPSVDKRHLWGPNFRSYSGPIAWLLSFLHVYWGGHNWPLILRPFNCAEKNDRMLAQLSASFSHSRIGVHDLRKPLVYPQRESPTLLNLVELCGSRKASSPASEDCQGCLTMLQPSASTYQRWGMLIV